MISPGVLSNKHHKMIAATGVTAEERLFEILS